MESGRRGYMVVFGGFLVRSPSHVHGFRSPLPRLFVYPCVTQHARSTALKMRNVPPTTLDPHTHTTEEKRNDGRIDNESNGFFLGCLTSPWFRSVDHRMKSVLCEVVLCCRGLNPLLPLPDQTSQSRLPRSISSPTFPFLGLPFAGPHPQKRCRFCCRLIFSVSTILMLRSTISTPSIIT